MTQLMTIAFLIFVTLANTSCVLTRKASRTMSDQQDEVSPRFVNTDMLTSGVWGHPFMAWDPDIIREGSKVHFFFASIFCKRNGNWHFSWDPDDPTACSIADGDLMFSIGYAFKDESVSNRFTFRPTPLISPGVPGSWEDGQIETPEVIKRGSKFHIFYCAMNKDRTDPIKPVNTNRYQIGVATIDLVERGAESLEQLLLGDTSIRFEKHPQNPILPQNPTPAHFAHSNTQEPSVVYREGRFELYYLGLRFTKKETGLPIGRGEIFNSALHNYGPLNLARVCLDDNLERLPCSLDDQPILTGVNMPNIYWHENFYYLFYTANPLGEGENHKNEKIFFRKSSDLVNWNAEQLVIAGGESSEDNWAVHSPAVAIAETGDGPLFEMVYQSWGVGPKGEDNDYCMKKRKRSILRGDPSLCNSSATGFARQQH